MTKVYKCSVPNCGRKSSDGTLIFHQFPKEDERRQEWVNSCGITKKIRRTTLVCSSHFSAQDYFPSRSRSKYLKKTAIPCITHPLTTPGKVGPQKTIPNILRRKKAEPTAPVIDVVQDNVKLGPEVNVIGEPAVNNNRPSNQQEEENQNNFQVHQDVEEDRDDVEMNESGPSNGSPNTTADFESDESNSDEFVLHCTHCGDKEEDIFEDECVSDSEAIMELQDLTITDENDEELIHEENIVRGKLPEFQTAINEGQRWNLLHMIRNDEDLIAFTGITFHLLESLTKAVNMCESESLQKKFSLSPKERIVLCLCKLRLNLTYRCLSVLFGVTRQSCSNNFTYMIDLLSQMLEKCIYWPTREQVSDSLPECFEKFPKTRVVIDCTETRIEKSKCLKCRLRSYSHYKGSETQKLMLVMNPNGLICYISKVFGGRASDKAIFNASGLLDKLEPMRDAVMIDKGFDIDLECLQSHIDVIMPPKLGKNSQLTAEQTLLTNEIARARVHVERAIQRMKMFLILKHKISSSLMPFSDKIATVIAALVNLKNPLLAEDKF